MSDAYEALLSKISSKNCFDFTGKTALITGASRGIGAAVAKLYAEFGAQVIVSSRSMDNIQPVVDEITAAGGKAVGMVCHIGDPQAIETLMTDIQAQYGRLDILVNNAATNPYYGPVLNTTDSAVDKTIEVNIKGYFQISQKAGLLMKENGGGAIINTASVNGVSPGPMQGIYSITKAAIISMTETFAKECARDNIRVNAVLP
ncbi:MAG: SDR family NAD(P)-dependent oxidoreductase, partial [Enterobacterales bacterium]|nr:SDR family NAD(P)-dependent oxidoreductase [Enterobacterales bacterium]